MKIVLLTSALMAASAGFNPWPFAPSKAMKKYKQYYVSDTGRPTGNEVKVTFLGVTTLLLDDGQTQVLIDGFLSRPSLFQSFFAKVKTDTAVINKAITTYDMRRVKGIFVTHSHYDHALDVAFTTRKTQAILYGSESTLNIARGGGVKETQLVRFRPYQRIAMGKFEVQVIPSIHSPGSKINEAGATITTKLKQPSSMKKYVEGGSFDFCIRHNGRTIYVKPSANYIEGALDSIRADVVFLGVGLLNKRTKLFQNTYYAQTVGKLKPSVVFPLHWDKFWKPLSEHLVILPRSGNSNVEEFDFLIDKTKADGVKFGILQGTKSVLLFKQ